MLYGIAFKQGSNENWIMSRYLFSTKSTAKNYSKKLNRKGYKTKVVEVKF